MEPITVLGESLAGGRLHCFVDPSVRVVVHTARADIRQLGTEGA